MRGAAAAVACVIGCGVNTGPPPIDPAGLMSEEAFEWQMSGLRATLARSGVVMDTEPTLRTCEWDHGDPGDCVVCDVATRADTRGLDPELLDRVAIAFARYPSKAITAAQLERVAVCSRIRHVGEDPDRGPAGLADLAAHRILISVEHFAEPHDLYFTIEQVVHHEVFHLFDQATLGDRMLRDPEWGALNPRGFAYRDPAAAIERPAGFVDAYATTNEMEDRASVFAYLMGHPEHLCAITAADPVVKKKAAVVWRRFAAVVGDAFLERHAPCLHRKPRAKPKPADKPKRRVDKRRRDLWKRP